MLAPSCMPLDCTLRGGGGEEWVGPVELPQDLSEPNVK